MSLRWLRAKTAAARVFCVALALVWLPCVSARADAELDLAWRSPAGCPDAMWARQRVAAQLGRELSAAASTPFRAQVSITRNHEKFRLTLSTSHGTTSGERTLEDARCEDLAEAATLMIALAIDADAVLEAQAQSDVSTQANGQPASQGAGVVTDTELPPDLRPKTPSQAPKPERDFRLRVSVLGDAGFLPGPSFGPELAVGLTRARFAVEAAGFWLPERRSKGEQQVAVSLWALALRGCMHRATGRWRVGGCLGAELGRVSADGVGLRENLQKRAWFVALDVPLRVRLRMAGPVWLASDLGLAVPFFRQRFVTQNTSDQSQTALHTPQPLTARASLGIEFAF